MADYLGIIRMSSLLLVSPAMAIGLTSAAIAIILLLAANVTITNAQQQQQQQLPTSQSAAIQNGTTLFQNIDDGFRVQVPEGWVIHDVNNTGSMLSEESTQGYGILAQLCPQEEEEQQQALPNAGSSNGSDTFSRCDESEQHIIHIVRYPDLDTRLQLAYNVTTNNMTTDNILLYHVLKLQEVGYRNITIVNSTYTTLNVTNAQTNQTIAIVPAKTVEMKYRTAASSAPNEIRRGYFILTATNATAPNPGITKGYSIFYEGTSTAAAASTVQTTTMASGSLPPTPAAVRQVFDSFELIAAEEVVVAQAGQAVSNQPDDLGEEPRGGGVEDDDDDDEEGGNGEGDNGGEGRGGGNGEGRGGGEGGNGGRGGGSGGEG